MTYEDACLIREVLQSMTTAHVRVTNYPGVWDQWCVEITPSGRQEELPLRIVNAEYDT